MMNQNLVDSEKKTENFLRIYDNVLPDEMVSDLMTMARQTVSWNSRSDTFRQDSQICLDAFWPQLVAEANRYIINKALSYYVKDFPYLSTNSNWWSGSMALQKTEPMEGYHTFHCEDLGWRVRNRVLAWTVYLNDVEEGGETEFLYQQLKIKPKANTAAIWPGGFTYLHRGNPPISETKYILTGWFSSMPDNLNSFSLPPNNY
tara:strand:+ start:19 stop:627 length:609 start_codon:yes stop_codon:yes gene_type:complete